MKLKAETWRGCGLLNTLQLRQDTWDQTLGFLLTFSGMVLFLFSYRRDEKRFTNITAQMFVSDMKSNTLNMHYHLADPAAFGVTDYTPVLSCYDAKAALHSQAETENTLAALKAIRPKKLSAPDAALWKLLTRSLEIPWR